MIPFNSPLIAKNTLNYVQDVFARQHASGDGHYTKLCHEWFRNKLSVREALLVHSGTAALEMAAMLANLQPGDEVIMPSYTFCSTANAFVLQGAVPVFVDVKSDTFNIDETKIEEAITPKTKAIVPVHYAGVACEMDTICAIAKKHNLLVIEDAAQAFDSYYKGRPIGTIGDMGCFSFHETKNVMSGEGGLFVTNNPELAERAEILREKGTNRSQFFRGQVDKYTWVDKGSSYLPSDVIGAYLYSVLEVADDVQEKRCKIWNKYFEAFKGLQDKGFVRLPIVPDHATNNAHMFYLVFNDLEMRTKFISYLRDNDIYAPFHYVPLHSSPAGIKFGHVSGDMTVTNKVSDTLVRLPMYFDMTDELVDRVIDRVLTFFKSLDDVALQPFLSVSKKLQLETRNWRNSSSVTKYFRIPFITEVMHENWILTQETDEPSVVAFLILSNGEFVGVTYFHSIDHAGKTADWGIYIYRDDLRGKGIGRNVLSQSIQFARTNLGLNVLYLDVNQNNGKALGLYQSLGFEILETVGDFHRCQLDLF